MDDVKNTIKAVYGLALLIVPFMFLASHLDIAVTLYFLSFLITIALRINRVKLQINSAQAEYYNYVNVIVTFGLAFCIILGLSRTDAFYYFLKRYDMQQHYQLFEWIGGFIFILIGLISFAYGNSLNDPPKKSHNE
jgi:hypothetical protein